jgi:uncharacterized protein YrrD
MVLEKYSEVVGLPVIYSDSGKKAGNIGDIIFYPEERKVKAFILEQKGYELIKKVILMKDVVSLGKDVMLIRDLSCIRTMKSLERSGELEDKGEIKGLRIISRAGNDLGVVKNILFDYKTGIVEGVEVSDGLIQDIMEGRKIIPLFGKVEFGEENILVSNEAVEEMQNTGGGIINKLLGEQNRGDIPAE